MVNNAMRYLLDTNICIALIKDVPDVRRKVIDVLDLFAKKREGVDECCQCENVASGQFQFPIEDAA